MTLSGNNKPMLESLSPTTWFISVDSIGAFLHLVPDLNTPAPPGNFRITRGDTILVELPAGSLVNQVGVSLEIEDGAGQHASIKGHADIFGSLKFRWTSTTSGPAVLHFRYKPFNTNDNIWERGVENKVIVGPRLTLAGRELENSAMCMQTVMSRCLGRMDTWKDKIQYATAGLNYNVIHFTPIQTTGESGSCYSLADQLSISPDLLPDGMKPGDSAGFTLLEQIVIDLKKSLGILSTSDVVLNHTANNTHWLSKHPEAGYCELNSPHLNAAISLDNELQQLSTGIAAGHFRHRGVSDVIEDLQTLGNLRRLVDEQVLKPFHIAEWFQIDVERTVAAYAAAPDVTNVEVIDPQGSLLALCLKSVGVARKNGVFVNGEETRALFKDEESLKRSLKHVQYDLNVKAAETHESVLNAIEGLVKYERIQCRKGRIGKTHWNAFVPRYFTPVKLIDGTTVHLANNGWVMGWNAETDFAAPGSLTYLNRSVIVWSDCVKLRFGECPGDCPFLWTLMANYCKSVAQIFHGIRLDNCHSTPLAVAKYCLREARLVNPDLFVYAELFTGKREVDLKFERELGINALIREALQSYDAKDFCRHIEEFGGDRLGTLNPTPALLRLSDPLLKPLQPTLSNSLYFDCTHDNETPHQKRTAVDALPNAAAVAAAACAIGSCRGYDELVPKHLSVVTERRQYHHYGLKSDLQGSATNGATDPDIKFSTSLMPHSSRVAVRGSWDCWQNDVVLSRRGGLWAGSLPASFLEAAIPPLQYKFVADNGSWFHDPGLPHKTDSHGFINNILYTSREDIAKGVVIDPSQWSEGNRLPGIMEAKKILNEIHTSLAVQKFTESETKVYGGNIIVITRHQPVSHKMCVFMIHTAFSPGVLSSAGQSEVSHNIHGKIDEILLEAQLEVPRDRHFKDEADFINGLPCLLQCFGREKFSRSRLNAFNSHYDESTKQTVIQFTSFPPGSVIVFVTEGFSSVRNSVQSSLQNIGRHLQDSLTNSISRDENLQAFSYLLYSCSSEERDRSKGARGPYNLGMSLGELPYAGIAGCIPLLDYVRVTRSLDHPIAKNITSGDWLFEYTADRLDADKSEAFSGKIHVVLSKVASWMRETFREPLRFLPRQLLTYYFDWIVSSLYSWIAKFVISTVPEPLTNCEDPFVQRLCLATLQVYSFVSSAPLIAGTNHASLCAGLPHFTTDYMRNWGRDTFIAITGCLLVTGRFSEARNEILGYARVMRHGLIPNLLDGGNNPRYNARDATWFFLASIADYCRVAPEGLKFLSASVTLKYLETLPNEIRIETIGDLIHFIMSAHAKGINFREWNSGPNLDSFMRNEGFDIKIYTDPQTGLIYGGNKWNCGTWMDKMGSSYQANTVGVPATPRDGAAIEINFLLKSVIRFLIDAGSAYKYDVIDDKTGFTYKDWHALLHRHLDSSYFTVSTGTKMYKDTLGSSLGKDLQLRPNMCIAMARAADGLSPIHMAESLELISSRLFCAKRPEQLLTIVKEAYNSVGTDASEVHEYFRQANLNPLFTFQLGLKTLDPEDPDYRLRYDNENTSSDPSVSAGFSYHNGPEWVWPVGNFLEAYFSLLKNKDLSSEGLKNAQFQSMRYLLRHRQYIAYDKWISLPELTNNDAEYCRFSCAAQAWSIGTILVFLSVAATPPDKMRLKGLLSHKSELEEPEPYSNTESSATIESTLLDQHTPQTPQSGRGKRRGRK